MKYIVCMIFGVLLVVPTALADPHPHGSSSGGGSSSSSGGDTFALGIPDAPSSAPGYMETAELCHKYPGLVCDMAVERLQGQDGYKGLRSKICKYSFGNIPFAGQYC